MPFRGEAARERDDQETIMGPRPDLGLAEGEWVRYWARVPHSISAKVISAATIVSVDPVTNVQKVVIDAGLSSIARLRLGIVDWVLFDNGVPIVWDRDQAHVLIDGLDAGLVTYLSENIGRVNEALSLQRPANPEQPKGETKGEG